MKKILLKCTILIVVLCSCQSRQQVTAPISTIDSTLQTNATAILESKLSEINAQSGQVIVMEVQSGQIKALVGLTRKDSANYQSCENFSVWQSTGLMHNWHRGGYGELTVQEGLAASSNIAIYKTMEKAFGDNPQTFFDLLTNMSYGKPDSINGIASLQPYKITEKNITWNCIGYEQLISPIQVLTFYNAIANNGKMIQPQLYKDSVVVINPQIASRASIDSLKKALVFNVTDGLGQPAKSDMITVAGQQGTIVVSTDNGNTVYSVEFCGYFPANNPKYSIIVSINKTGLPASGGLMAGDVFKKIIVNLKQN